MKFVFTVDVSEHCESVEVRRPATSEQVERMEKRIMAALQDLQVSIAGLGSDLDAELAAIEAKLNSIPPGGTSDADIANVTASVGSLRAVVQAETAKLSAPTPPPAPAPVA